MGRRPRGRGRGRGRGGGRRGAEGGIGRGSDDVLIEEHSKHEGVFVVGKGSKQQIATINLVRGEAVNNENLYSVQEDDGTEVEYRQWNPSRSKLAAVILKGVDNIWIKPGFRVLYLGADSLTTVSHVSNIVGDTGRVYVVTSSPGTELTEVANNHANVTLITEDPHNPANYHEEVGKVNTILSEVHELYQAKMLASNASFCLDVGGHFVVSIKAPRAKSYLYVKPGVVIGVELESLLQEGFDPSEEVTLKSDHAYLIGAFNVPN